MRMEVCSYEYYSYTKQRPGSHKGHKHAVQARYGRASTLHTKAPNRRHGQTHFGLTRLPIHMGCPVGEAAGRADPTGQKSHRLLLAQTCHVPSPKSPALMAKHARSRMQRASHAGPIIMAGHARQEVQVPEDVDAVNGGQDVPGLRLPDSAHSLTWPFLPCVGRVVICGVHGLAKG